MFTLTKGAELEQMTAMMAQLVRDGGQSQAVRQLALSIVPSYPDNQVLAIYNYVKGNVKYQLDPADTELVTTPDKMVELVRMGSAYGDCDDMAVFTSALLRSIGYDTKIAVLDRQGLGFDHATAMAYLPAPVGTWVFVDPVDTQHPMGWTPSYNAIQEVA